MTTDRLVLGTLMALLFVGALDCRGQDAAAAADAAQEDAAAVDATQLSEHELTVLYTKTNLSIAELELQQALELNQGDRKIVPRLTVERLRSNLAVAKEQYRQAMLESSDGPERVRLRHAQEKVRVAKADLEVAQKLKEQKALGSWEEQRLELQYDLARLHLALLQHPGGYRTLLDGMQRQLDRYGEEILALEQRITKLESNRWK
jgi:hypothetical protein